jgi:cytoskeletal protein RodZ
MPHTIDSIGKKLHDKRLEKQMSIADAARLTHIRPERLVDLENDDYSNFPSLAYARGFLIIYGGLLNVDVSGTVAKFENRTAVEIDEYEYLSGKPAPLTRSQRGGKKLFLVLVALFCFLFVVGALVWHMVNTNNRLDNLDQFAGKDAGKNSASAEATPPPAENVAPTAAPAAVAADSTIPAPAVANASPSATAAPAPSEAPKQNEIVLHPIKKTWVKIQKDSVTSAPIYEDWLYPDANGLTLRGGKFWIQLNDGDAVQITKNGQRIPYNSPGIVVE